MPGTIVVALGGNALAPPGEQPTIANQFRHTRKSLRTIIELARAGWRIAIVHGNGPQVGAALERNELATKSGVEPLPLGILVASTVGWIGYMIQQSLQNGLRQAGVDRKVVTLVTQTICDANDPRLLEPTKPIGHAVPPDRLDALREMGTPVAQDKTGRWRRLAPSPLPIGIVEMEMVRSLVTKGHLVVACGGGGTPVYRHAEGGWEGLDAVVDKDFAAAILAEELAADVLLILTNVDGVYEGFGTPEARRMERLTVTDAERALESGALGVGSMGPKVRASALFVRHGGPRAIIAELGDGLRALEGKTGTSIVGETL